MDEGASSPYEGREPMRRSEERRIVTTLFCDLVGFTAISERNDAEVVDAMLRRYYAVARRVVESYGGTVEKYIGDAVVAVFGVPDPARGRPRARRARRPAPGRRDRRAAGHRRTRRSRCASASTPARRWCASTSIRRAARASSPATPSTSPPPAGGGAADGGRGRRGDARRDRAGLRLRRLPPRRAQGQEPALRAWIATAPLARTGSELRSFASSLRRARGGARRPAGPARRGHERLQPALRSHLRRARHRQEPPARRVRPPPGRRSRPWSPGARAAACPSARTSPSGPSPRSSEALPASSRATAWRAPRRVSRPCCPRARSATGRARACARCSAWRAEEASREENFEVWRAFLEGLAADGPAIVVVEDLHWADEAMLAFMDFLVQSNAQVPLLVLATARPEVLELGGRRRRLRGGRQPALPLGPLSGEETAELARSGARRHVAAHRPAGADPRTLAAATRCSPRSSCASSRIAACWRTAAARSASGPAPRSRCPTRSARSSPPVSTCSAGAQGAARRRRRRRAAPSGSGRWPQSEALSPPRSTRA